MSRLKNNLLSTVVEKFRKDGLSPTSFLGGDEVGIYWDSDTWVGGSYDIIGNLDGSNNIEFPGGVNENTESFIKFSHTCKNSPLLQSATNKTDKGRPLEFNASANPLENRYVKSPVNYNPLKDAPSLFSKFFDLSYDIESILKFTEEYGMLGGDIGNKDGQESILAWFWEIYHMKLCMRLCDYTSDEYILMSELSNVNTLEDFFTVDDGSINLEIKKENQAPYIPAIYFIEWFHTLDPAERSVPLTRILPSIARTYVQQIIEDHLNHRITMNYRRLVNDQSHLMNFKLNGLIGALWFQFYQYANGLTTFGVCQTCRKWFIHADEKKKKEKKFCSDKCRVSFSRRVRYENDIINKLKRAGCKEENIRKGMRLSLDNEKSIQNNFLNRKTSYYADIVVLDKNGKGGISIIEVKSRKRRAQDEALLFLDEVFSLNDKVNKAFVVFQDYVLGRTKSKKTWTGLTDGEFHNEFK